MKVKYLDAWKPLERDGVFNCILYIVLHVWIIVIYRALLWWDMTYISILKEISEIIMLLNNWCSVIKIIVDNYIDFLTLCWF